MKYSIMGFNQAKLLETDLDLTDLMILDYITNACGSTGMYHRLDSNGNPLVWISHNKFHEDLPFLHMSESTLKNRLSSLRQRGYIHSIVVASESGKGSRTYYGITDTTTYLKKDVVDTTTYREKDVVELPRTAKSTSDSILKKDDKELKKDDTNIVENFIQSYNNTCTKLPSVRKVADKRKKAIRNIVSKYTKEEIETVLQNANNSDFLTGKNDRGWTADIDFILREDKFVNILEGKYGGHSNQVNKFGESNKVVSNKEVRNEFTGSKY